ncbi:MAG: hypothetical protein K2N25_01990, partial [Muribaculaceae bacterium]|nr:hypothetical protein [Muribaculaceae bacterium]
MKKTSFLKMAIAIIALSASTISCTTTSNAGSKSSPDLSSILGGAGGALGNLVEGVFTKTDLTVKDIAGE